MPVPDVFGLVAIPATLFGLGIGLPMVYFGLWRDRDRDAVLDRVETVEAEILTSEVERTRSSLPEGGWRWVYRPVVEFRYRYRGRTYESDFLAYDLRKRWPDESIARERADQYPVGATVSAYVDPDDPGTAFLETDHATQGAVSIALVVIGAATTLIGLFGAAVAVWVLLLT